MRQWGSVWQMKLLTASELSKFVRERGLHFWEGSIELLWRLGLLQAELVISRRRIKRKGLVEVKHDGDQWVYSDERTLRLPSRGLGRPNVDERSALKNASPLFHPYRYFVLYHLSRVLRLNISRTQILFGPERLDEVMRSLVERFQAWSKTPKATERITYWNDVAALTILSEPTTYESIFRSWSCGAFEDQEEQSHMLSELRAVVQALYSRIGLERVERIRQDLCIATQVLDDNRDVHTLLLLSHPKFRKDLKGHLGGALLMRTMAESLRRQSEEVWGRKLREEDELGFGWWPDDLKQRLYGESRLLDGSRTAQNAFLRQLRVDRGLRVRWYVEGETEFQAIQHVVGLPGENGVELINLAGRVAQKGHVTFRDNLRADISMGVFSFVSLDADREDNLRTLTKAVQDGDFFGLFYISKPDFEFENFSLDELEAVLWDIALTNGACESERQILHSALVGVKTGKALMSRAANALPCLARVAKGATWGEELAKYALANPEKQPGVKRQFIDAVGQAIRSNIVNYQYSRREFTVDMRSGRLVKKEASPTDNTESTQSG